jgi:hypothetical protein
LPPHYHLALFITFLTLFLKLLGLQERVPKASSGNWFPKLYGPIYKGVFPEISPLLSAPNFLEKITPAQVTWCLQSLPYSLPSPFTRDALKRAHKGANVLRSVMVSQFDSFLWCVNLAAFFCTPSNAFI